MVTVIESEEQAWDVLEKILSGELRIESAKDFQLGDWASVSLYIPGKQYDSALTTYMMSGWVEAQRSVYRSYALVASGSADARNLTDIDKDRLEIVVRVSGGSSDQDADLSDIIAQIVQSAVNKMEPWQIITVLISLGLIYTGGSVLRTWIESKKEEKIAETSSKNITEALEAVKFTVASDAEKREILNRAVQRVPIVSDLSDEADAARHSLIKHASKTDAELNGVSLPSNVTSKLTRESRAETTDERLDGPYKILKVDTTVPDGFRVLIEDVNTEESFQASVQDVMASEKDREIIQQAEWSKIAVRLKVNAKRRRGEVFDATIMSAKKIEQDDA